MPDFGYVAMCSYCEWIATDDAGDPALYGQLDAAAAALDHMEAAHPARFARLVGRFGASDEAVEAEAEAEAEAWYCVVHVSEDACRSAYCVA